MKRGRPTIDGDADALLYMAILKRDADRHGRKFSVRRAADEARKKLMVAGTMPESVSDRLRTKFAQQLRDGNSLPSRIISQHGASVLRHLPSRQQEQTMLALATETNGDELRRLEDLAGYAAARQKLTEIRQHIDAHSARLAQVKAIVRHDTQARLEEMNLGAEVYLSTGKLLARASHEEERDRLEGELEILNRSYFAQAQIVETEKGNAHEEAQGAVRSRHKALVQAVLSAATALADAIQREADFRDEVARAGFHFPHMTDVSDTLEPVFGRGHRQSAFREFATRARDYLGQSERKRG